MFITGGSGFLGQGLITKLLKTNCDRICIYSRGEHRQAFLADKLKDQRLRFFIGDVRDKQRLKEAMRGVDTVIHSAALKRIEVGAYSPIEMVKTNVYGTINAVEAAVETKVKSFVFVSSDKAYQPISPYGQTKALAERIVLNSNTMHGWHGPMFSACRYGNVWNSQGSVVPKWKAHIAMGLQTVPITHPDCTRFFMTLDEAADLVLSAIGTNRLHIPELPAYRLGDLAEAMNVGMEITGLPDYEKMHEGMRDGLTSDLAPRMTIKELQEAISTTHIQ